jgi:hypothetical protein
MAVLEHNNFCADFILFCFIYFMLKSSFRKCFEKRKQKRKKNKKKAAKTHHGLSLPRTPLAFSTQQTSSSAPAHSL